MTEATNERLVLSAAAQNLLRIVIASYFLACGSGLIPGSDLSPLFSSFLPEALAGPLGAAVVFVLAYLVMIGVWLRGAALTLGILTFWASYLRMLELGVVGDLGGFWRDLALIAALMMTYAETDPRNQRKRTPLRRKVAARKVQPRRMSGSEGEASLHKVSGQAAAKTRVTQAMPTDYDETGSPVVRHAHLRRPVTVEEMETIFQTEFETVRSI